MEQVVLIVEDEPRNLKLVRDLLTAKGYTTLEATNGQQGIALARLHTPDLILMDIYMPVMDGLEATRALKADPQTAGIPIIALTALGMKGDIERIRQAGCDGYLTKPFHIRELLAQVAAHLGG